MMDLNKRNTTKAPLATAELIPARQYIAVITGAELKPAEDGSRRCAQITFQITEGPYAGRCLLRLLDPNHPDPRVARFYHAEIRLLCEAVGISPIRDYDDPASYAVLHGRSLVIEVIRDTRPNGNTVNWIVDYLKRTEDPLVDPLPTEHYVARIVESKIESSGWVELVFEIIEGPHAGRQLRERLAPSAVCSTVAKEYREVLRKICRAAGAPGIRDYADPASYTALHNRPLVISVHYNEYSGQNSIVCYFKRESNHDQPARN